MEFDLDKTIEILERTPRVLKTQLQGLPNEWLLNCYGPNTWSAHEVIGHLVWGERTDWLSRTKHLLGPNNHLPFAPFDRNGHSDLCKEFSTFELIEIFENERLENVADLRGLQLTDADLERQGAHPALGPVILKQLLATWTVHDLNHIAQVNKAMAYQYGESTGPWNAYLSILSPPNPR